ncbi:MAG: DUF1801 domain-containing protein [Planctomycetota bacterium]|nr:DUF1801 domain-containing protein [Planctomycetota bacterium]
MAKAPATPEEYLAALPEDRRHALEVLRATILKNLGKGFEEGIQYGMIGYFVPHSVYPNGYHCDPRQPLPFASIASQKSHIGIYLFCIYTEEGEAERFREEWLATGKRLDMGKSCVRVKKIEDVPLDVLGRAIKRATLKRFVASYEASLASTKAGQAARKMASAAKKPAAKKATTKQTSPKKAVAKKPAAKARAKKG